MVSNALEHPISGSTDDTIKWMAGSLCRFDECSCSPVGTYIYVAALDGGSADTSTGTIAGFLLNMVLHPEIQAKAQAEIDRVVGSERLPTFTE